MPIPLPDEIDINLYTGNIYKTAFLFSWVIDLII